MRLVEILSRPHFLRTDVRSRNDRRLIGRTNKSLVVVYAMNDERLMPLLAQDEEQFFTLVSHRQDMYLAHLHPISLELSHGLVPVEHRRELHHHEKTLVRQLFFQAQQIRSTIANGHRLAALTITTGRIQVDYCGVIHPSKIVHAVGTHHLCLPQT